MKKTLLLFFAASVLACAETPLITGYFAVSGYWKVENANLSALGWAALTNAQWTGMTNTQWTGMVN